MPGGLMRGHLPLEIRPAGPSDGEEWLRMRCELWPQAGREDLAKDVPVYFGNPDTHLVMVAAMPEGGLAGFAEFRLRNFADECYTSPVAYLEGWYVDADVRRHGIGRRLVAGAESWARARGCLEFGSDALAENEVSRAAHRAMGFEEGSVVVHFRRSI